MAGEPGVGLNRDRVAAQRLVALLDRGSEPAAVALVREVAVELADQQAPMGEDEHAHRSRSLDEARCCDRLAGGGRMSEAVPALRPRVLRDRRLVVGIDLGVVSLLAVVLVVGQVRLVVVAVAVRRLRLPLVTRDQLGQHAGERVDLVPAQLGARAEMRRAVGQHALEAEHEGELDLPGGRGSPAPLLDLGYGFVERATACAPRRQHLRGIVVLSQERLAGPLAGTLRQPDKVCGGLCGNGRGGRGSRHAGSRRAGQRCKRRSAQAEKFPARGEHIACGRGCAAGSSSWRSIRS